MPKPDKIMLLVRKDGEVSYMSKELTGKSVSEWVKYVRTMCAMTICRIQEGVLTKKGIQERKDRILKEKYGEHAFLFKDEVV